MPEMRKCKNAKCAVVFEVNRRGQAREFCNALCYQRDRYSKAKGGNVRVYQQDGREALGPERPTLGWTPEELLEYKRRRMLELVSDGVPTEAISERLGLDETTVRHTVLTLTGKRRRFVGGLPFGLPA